MLKKITTITSIVLITLVILLLITLKVAPAIGIHFAGKWYSEQGEDYRLEVADWQFSPFNTKLALHHVVLHHPNVGDGKTELSRVFIKLNIWDLLDRKVSIQAIELEGLRLKLLLEQIPDHEGIELAGLSIPLGADTETQAEAEQEETSGDQESWQINLDKLAFNDLQFGWDIKIQELNVQGKATLERFSLQDFSTIPGSQPQVHLALTVEQLQLNEPELNLQQPLKIETRGQVSHIFDNPTWQGDVSINNLLLQQGAIVAGFNSLQLDGVLANAKLQRLDSMQLDTVAVQVDASTQLNLHELIAKGLQANTEQGFSANLDSIELHQLDLLAQDIIANIQTITVAGVAAEEQQQSVQKLGLQQLKVITRGQELATLENYQLHDFTMQELAEELVLSLGEHSFSGLVANIERNAQGELVGITAAEADEAAVEHPQAEIEPETNAAESEQADAVAKALAVALVGFSQQGEADTNAVVQFTDASVAPKLKTQIVLKQLRIGKADSRIEGDKVAIAAAIPVFAKLGIGDFSTTEIDAQLSLYQTDTLYPEGHIKLTTRKLDIVDFNGYVIKALGYQIDRGSLDIDADITIHQTKLKGEVKLLLRNAKFTPANEETIDRISKQISMPLDTAIGLLRDENGNVHLTIPVEGRLDDPDFGLKDISRQLSKKAFKLTALYLIKQSMQPYGTMLSVASFAGEYLFAIRLDALQYVAGASELTADQQANLKKVAELMQSKNKIEVRACPFVGAEELTELGDEWSDLAKARGLQIKQWFEENYPTESERLTICRPQKGKVAEVVLGVS